MNSVTVTNNAASQPAFDFSKSNLILMIGGQILLLSILLMVVFFGTPPLAFPANAVRRMFANRASAAVANS